MVHEDEVIRSIYYKIKGVKPMKIDLTLDELNELLRVGYDMPRGWSREKIWHTKAIRMWKEMWRRSYLNENYKYVEVFDEFKLFSNFLKWIQAQPRFEEFCSTCSEVKWSIDKDKKDFKNRHYFPQYMTLCLLSENLSERHNRNPNKFSPIIGINIKDNTILIFKSRNKAKEKGFDPCTITKCCKNTRRSHKGYKWFYLDMNDRG